MKKFSHGVFYCAGRTALVLVAALLIWTCGTGDRSQFVTIVWEGDNAVGLVIKKVYATNEDIPRLEVRLVKEGDRTAVLGNFTHNESDITFTPVVPLTRGLRYELLEDGIVFGEIDIPASDADAPEVQAIYPSRDTVPENLLKVYIRFSQPMAEGRSAQYVHLLKDGRDTMKGTFLDLQPELWNEGATILTLWLDPGRIKLDLIPNKELGNPLQQGVNYQLVVGKGWKSKQGVAMEATSSKAIYVTGRDDQSPDVQKWTLGIPATGTSEPLIVRFGEPLDRMLAEGAMQVVNDERVPVEGKIVVTEMDQSLQFNPVTAWSEGKYSLVVESRLEDLAGNNLNRLFEVDLSKTPTAKAAKESFEKNFRIE